MTVNDYFLGAEMSVLSCDKFAMQHIEDEVLKEDLTLMETKWWDYRTMHPVHATLYFYRVYNSVLGDFIGRNISTLEGAKHKRYSDKLDLRTKSLATIRAFWKARMAADAIGMPYEPYIRAILTNFYDAYHKFATTKGGKQKAPFPSQLTSTIMIQRAVQEWEELRKAKLHIPESDLILHKQVWFREDMEASLHEHARLTDHPESYTNKAVRVGAILPK